MRPHVHVGDSLFDSRHMTGHALVAGALLHGLIGYDDRPAGMQIVFYVFTLVAIITAMKWARRQTSQNSQQEAVT